MRLFTDFRAVVTAMDPTASVGQVGQRFYVRESSVDGQGGSVTDRHLRRTVGPERVLRTAR
ncbi:hypothetical protein RN2511_005660 [Rhodococcus sp. NKCM2511]|nr:hypothetical protein RN2511_005660 [Rhodococcus sp. NKCM2511]